MRILRRTLSKKERKRFLSELKERVPWLEASGEKVEEVKVRNDKEFVIYLIDDKPIVAVVKDKLIPVLTGQRLDGPGVTVDQGAVKHIVNGADVMRPGITQFKGEFKKGDIILVFAETLSFPIAVGEALYDKEEMEGMKRGKVVKNLHHLGDEIYEVAKKL